MRVHFDKTQHSLIKINYTVLPHALYIMINYRIIYKEK
jgi:hypothetical protein